MGVYRSDQAQLTFSSEPYPGAYAENASAATAGTGAAVIKNANGIKTGAWQINIDALTGTNMGPGSDYPNWIGENIRITNATTATTNDSEVRIVEHIVDTGTGSGASREFILFLNAPLAFDYADDSVVTVVVGVTANTADMYATQIPGVYETVDVPDPENAIEARYFLGTASRRNFYSAYKGQQSYTGAVPGFILLDGKPLRFPIGKIVSKSHNQSPTGYTNPLKFAAATVKGQVWVPVTTVSGSQAIEDDQIVMIEHKVSTYTLLRTDTCEIRKIVSVAGSTSGTISSGSTTMIRLDYPLQYPHSTNDQWQLFTSAARWEHEIFETVDLDTVSWHLHMRDSSETNNNDFDRRYYGGKIGGATISADEGGMLTMSWDGVNFMGMVHNQQLHSAYGSGSTNLPYYTVMQDIRDGNVAFPTSQPYYYSQGSVKLFNTNTEIASIRSFSLSIANNEEPRYYIQRRHGRNRGPVEIREQQREYSLGVTLALPDATTSSSTTGNLFKELMLEGDYGTGMQGFDIRLLFERGDNDSIEFRIPAGTETAHTAGTISAVGGNTQGAFIRTAPHSISGENPLQVEADILFRNMSITIRDDSPTGYYYP